MPNQEQLRAATETRPVRPRAGEIGSLRQTLREILFFAKDDDPDRERARLRARARACPWNRPIYDAYIRAQNGAAQ